jgi:hypothetical protein
MGLEIFDWLYITVHHLQELMKPSYVTLIGHIESLLMELV